MKKLEIIEKLNKHNNFHLSLNVIMISDDNIIDNISNQLDKDNITNIVIENIDEAYDKLLLAYENKVKIVLVNEQISFVLPKMVMLTNDNYDVIKPYINTYYTSKDNKITSKIQTNCRKKNSNFTFVNKEDIYNIIVNSL